MEQVDEHVRVAPAPGLRPYVAWYSGYRQRGLPPAVHRGLPSPALTLIFTLDEPLVLLDPPGAGARRRSFDSLIAGLHTAPALITHQGAQSGVQLALRPLGARALLGLPAGELAALDLPADAVLGGAGRRMSDRLREARGWPGRFAVLDQELTGLVRADRPRAGRFGEVGRVGQIGREAPAELRHAWNLLRRGHGNVPIAVIAAEVGWSTRHLSDRFRVELGLTPKAAARVIRFDRARRLLVSRDRRWRLADLAAECGYFDQAHLARDFRALTGCSPSGWLAAEFRNVQADGYGFDESLDGPGRSSPGTGTGAGAGTGTG
ncbi:AraC family transcriptional regulator [Parafrankia irregularis]|uniref:AraC family transcriptional regulator n=1 Tax=Parafrankia irregularis TaxID=795642 RepID=UPI0013F4F6BF|nr:helix-turn-helix domain-containing protein [Parafrankia irregularis]MBE3204213.1 AraC family transcriptional regulator [Parafrankia sp. CH37]